MGKLLETKAKRKSTPAAKKPIKRAAPRKAVKKAAPRRTLREMNAWLTRNQDLVLRKAKENTLRLIGRETL
jgi:hypothetical protein